MDREALIARLLDHYQHPRNRGPLGDADVIVTGGDPGCGDTVIAYLKIAPSGDHIAALSFDGQGCTVSQAAASLLSERMVGAPFAAVDALSPEEMIDILGREVVGARPRCATLALRTLKIALATYRRERHER